MGHLDSWCHRITFSCPVICSAAASHTCFPKMWIHLFNPPSLLSNHNFQSSVGAEFSSSLLTVDCKCPNLGRQPFLITRITLLSNRKIKLNNSIAYSWSQTAALWTHQSPVKLFHAPPITHTSRRYTNGNLLLTCVAAFAPHLVWSQCTTRKKALFCSIYVKNNVWNEKFLWGFLWHIKLLGVKCYLFHYSDQGLN